MSLFNKAFNAYRDASLQAGFHSDDEVVKAWTANPEKYFYLIRLRLQAIQIKKAELGLA